MTVNKKVIIGAIELNKRSDTGKVVQRVLKAAFADHYRGEFTMAYYDHEEKMLIATDGKRIHRMTGKEIDRLFAEVKDSCYVTQENSVLVCYNKEYAAFPSWKKVVPKEEETETVQSIKMDNEYWPDIEFTNKRTFNQQVAYFTLVVGAPTNLLFLQDLIGSNYQIIRQKTKKESPVQLRHMEQDYTFTALIMPMRQIDEIKVWEEEKETT